MKVRPADPGGRAFYQGRGARLARNLLKFLAHSHRRTAFASTPQVGIQGPAIASVGGRTRPASAGLFLLLAPTITAAPVTELAPGGRRNRGNPRGPCAGRQRTAKTREPHHKAAARKLGGFFIYGRTVTASANG